MCVCERERERERETQGGRGKERKGGGGGRGREGGREGGRQTGRQAGRNEKVCVCVCVCVFVHMFSVIDKNFPRNDYEPRHAGEQTTKLTTTYTHTQVEENILIPWIIPPKVLRWVSRRLIPDIVKNIFKFC